MAKQNTATKLTTRGAIEVKKSSIVEQLLTREGGASLEELTAATGWQPHSCRAFLTGLRKKGWGIDRKTREDGTTTWIGRAPATAEGRV
jgi:hypothetical protein